MAEKTLTKEEYDSLKTLEQKHKDYHLNGSITLSETEKGIFRPIYKRLEGYDFCNSCPDEIKYAFSRVFKAFYATPEEKPRRKRQRL